MTDDAAQIIVTCQCGQKMKAPAEAKGKTYKCVRCGAAIRVEGAPKPPAAAATASSGVDTAQEPIGQLLIAAGLISSEQLEEALNKQRKSGGKTFEILIGLGHLTKENLHDFLSRQPGVAAIELRRFEIDRKLVEIIPKEIALENLILPIDRLGKLLTVAMACPLDRATIENVEKITGLKVKALLCKLDDIHAAVKRYYPVSDEVRTQEMLDTLSKGSAAPKKDWRAAAEAVTMLPLDPDIATLIRELAASADSDLRMLAATAATDTGVAAAILRMANSPMYGLPGEVNTVPMAVAVLGKAGVLGVIRECDDISLPLAPEMPQLRRRACRCAEIAAALAKAGGQIDPGAAFTVALLLELGSHALAAVAPEEYKRISPDIGGSAREEAEIKRLGIGHSTVGHALASRWDFPETICLTIRHYVDIGHAPTEQVLAHIAALATWLTTLKTPPSKGDTDALRKPLAVLSLGHDALVQIFKEIAQ